MKRQAGTDRKRIGVIMGGSSSERDVSLRSGAAVADALAARGHDVVRFMLGETFGPELLTTLSRARIDTAFLALHGRLGEDGCIQGLLEIAQIPYTGSSVLASALAMDKLKAKELFRLHNVPTPPYYMIEAKDLADLESVHGAFGFPVMVKPRGEGSSLGVSKANDVHELSRAVALAFEFDDVVIVERFVVGTEVDVAILDGRVLGAIEIAPKKGFYDYEAKYTPGMTDYFMPARLPPARLIGVQNLALRAARALGTTGAVRVDLLVTAGENEYVLEVNTLPGMTQTSLLPKIASAAGYDFGALCEAILDGARTHQPSRRKIAARVTELRPNRTPLLRVATG
ncbi:MAG: D-alanine--D-alanine ligase [Polyangiaceae bacterium]|nr:D-alanine--D-alanine ligase [Polyangiaceae bacterium]